MKHTPGPWTNNASISRLTVTTGSPTYSPIAYCFDMKEEHEANARLIAASPELLEACKAVRNHLREYMVDGRIKEADEIMIQVQQAIKQAEEGRG